MPCQYCEVPANHIVKQYKYWTVHMAESQQLLGYTIISLNRHIEYLIDVTDDELLEFRERFGKSPERRWIFEEEPFLVKLVETIKQKI